MSFSFLQDGWRQLVQQVSEIDVLNLALRLTLLMLLLGPVGSWNVRALILLLCGLGLVFPALLYQPLVWGGLTILTGWRVIADYPLADNHAYLLCYWCLAITCALLSKDAKATLAFNGKILIGLVFLLATVQKAVISPDFTDGRFFRHTLSVDERFENFAILAGGADREAIDNNRRFLESDAHEGVSHNNLNFKEPVSLYWLAFLLTWGTLILEGALAASFLWLRRDWFRRQRNRLLIVFCLTTYAVATVAGFGRLLVVMGLAQSNGESRETRWAYLVTYALILIYEESPWLAVLAGAS